MILTNKNTLINRYIRTKIKKYKINKATIVASDTPVKGTHIRKKWHPFLMKLLRIKSKFLGLTHEIISDKNIDEDKTVIFAVTHIGKCDYEMVVEALGLFAYPFAGDWELMYATIDDYFLRANGVLYVDTTDKEDRKNSYKFMYKLLKQGTSVIIFPEGIWNLSPNLPTLKLFPGCVQATKECLVPIVPIAIEQVDKHFIINVGEELSFNDMQENEAIHKLRNVLATLKWQIWEQLPHIKRSELSLDYYKKFLEERIAEFNGYSIDIINQRMYKDKLDREFLAIKQDLDNHSLTFGNHYAKLNAQKGIN